MDVDDDTTAQSQSFLGGVKSLYARLNHVQVQQVKLRDILPVFERVLEPRTRIRDCEQLVHRELQKIRKYLSSQSDVFDVVEHFDQCVEECLADSENNTIESRSIIDIIRLLIALSGGYDGRTYVLLDPTLVLGDVNWNKSFHPQSSTRLGDRIRMNNTDMIQPITRLMQSRTQKDHPFKSFVPSSVRSAQLWYPPPRDDTADKASVTLKSFTGDLTNRFMIFSSDANLPIPSHPFIRRALVYVSILTTRFYVVVLSGGILSRPSTSEHNHTLRCRMQSDVNEKETFFVNGSKEFQVDSSFLEESVTESSNDDDGDVGWNSSNDSHFLTWEDLGNPRLMCPWVEPESILKHEIEPIVTQHPVFNVDEEDALMDVRKALCGIESVLFRRDIPNACLHLPRKCAIKFHTSSTSILVALLENFCKAATAFLRLEFYAVYFAQDPSRGGKTAQAFANALKLYLSTYQKRIMDLTSSSVSLLHMESVTRALQHQIVHLEAMICGDRSVSIWKRLRSGNIPHGMVLLDKLYMHVHDAEANDVVVGGFAVLLKWLFVKAAVPFISVLSAVVSTGCKPYEDVDNEFQWCSDENEDIKIPSFMHKCEGNVLNIRRLQSLLHSIIPKLAAAVPIDQLHLHFHFVDAASQLERTTNVVREFRRHVHLQCVANSIDNNNNDLLRVRAGKSPRVDEEDEWVANKRSRLQEKHRQQLQREMLDDQRQKQREARDMDAKCEREAIALLTQQKLVWEKAQLEHGKQLLMEKYSVLMDDADSRYRYMKWRRDRAVRYSAARKALMELYTADKEDWSIRTSAIRDFYPIVESTIITEADGDAVITKVIKPPDGGNASCHGHPADESNDCRAWRPTIRVQQVPGGGGSDVHTLLYAIDQQRKTEFTQFNRGLIDNTSGGSGTDTYDSIYGKKLAVINVTTPSRRSINGIEEIRDEERGSHDIVNDPAIQIQNEVESENDVSMDSVDGSNDIDYHMDLEDELCDQDANVESYSGGAETSTSSTVVPIKDDVSILDEVTTTGFFADAVSEEDAAILRLILDQKSSSPLPVPFHLIVHVGLERPIALINQELEQIALQVMMTKLNILNHLTWLFRIALMGEGLCMSIFSRDVVASLRSGPPTRVMLATHGQLTMMLDRAMSEAQVEIKKDIEVTTFHYQVTPKVETALNSGFNLPSLVTVLENISLHCILPHHLDIVITPPTRQMYTSIHRYLLHLRLTEFELKEIWVLWRKRKFGRQNHTSSELLDMMLYMAQFVVAALGETYTHHILMMRWSTFVESTSNCTSITHLRELHEGFTKDVQACCFVDRLDSEAHIAITSFFQNVWEIATLVRTADLERSFERVPYSIIQRLAQRQSETMQNLISQLTRFEVPPTQDGAHSPCFREFKLSLLQRLNMNAFFSLEDKTF